MRHRFASWVCVSFVAAFAVGCPHQHEDNPPQPAATQAADSGPAKELLDGLQTDIQSKDWSSAASKVTQLAPMGNQLSAAQQQQLLKDEVILNANNFGGKYFQTPATPPADGTAPVPASPPATDSASHANDLIHGFQQLLTPQPKQQ